jgi:hypothetical protein
VLASSGPRLPVTPHRYPALPAPATSPNRPGAEPRSIGRLLELGLSLYAAGVFGVFWVGLAVDLSTRTGLIDDAWSWLSTLEPIPAALVWVLVLPIAVGLWAAHADLPPVVAGLVGLGIVLWTITALSSLVRAFRSR